MRLLITRSLLTTLVSLSFSPFCVVFVLVLFSLRRPPQKLARQKKPPGETARRHEKAPPAKRRRGLQKLQIIVSTSQQVSDKKRRVCHQPTLKTFSHATPLRRAAKFGTIHTEPVKRFISSRKALPTRNRVLGRKAWGPIFFIATK